MGRDLGFFLGDVSLDEYLVLEQWPQRGTKVEIPAIRCELGGMIANAAAVHARLPAPTAYCWALNTSRYSAELLEDLADQGIDVRPVVRDPSLGDSRCLILLAEDEHCVLTPEIGLGTIEITDAAWELLTSARFLYTAIGDLRSSRRRGRPLGAHFAELAAHGVTRVIDLDVGAIGSDDLPLISAMDLVFMNARGAEALAALGMTPQSLVSAGVQCVVTTNGPLGCHAVTPTSEVMQPGLDVPVRDVTGAGDTFGAVFTHVWLDTNDLVAACALANAAAARAVTTIGARAGVASLTTIADFAAGHRARRAPRSDPSSPPRPPRD